MHRPHMSGREPQRTADPGRGGVPAAHYIHTYIGVSLLAALGHWKPVRDLGEKGLQGLQASTLVAYPRDRQIPRASYAPHRELCTSISKHLGAPGRHHPRPAPTTSPVDAPLSRKHPRPVSPAGLPASSRPQSRPTLRAGCPGLLLFFRLRPRSPALRQPR